MEKLIISHRDHRPSKDSSEYLYEGETLLEVMGPYITPNIGGNVTLDGFIYTVSGVLYDPITSHTIVYLKDKV